MPDSSPGAFSSPLTAGYAPPPGAYDELGATSGEVRPEWQHFLTRLSELGQTELDRRWESAQHVIRENGVTYNVYGDPQGLARPWSLSPVPLLIEPAAWDKLERGLGQRALLHRALLQDLYGPQRVLAEGLVPPDIVFGHPNFIRALHGVPALNDCWLASYAADLIRGENGEFLVLGDKTQVPSGSGYALENRIVISRALPEAFREGNVQRLALFFRNMRETLTELAPHNRDHPRIVLLASGPANATYFEQAYLAKYLDFTLVNGADLTVRDDRVFLKTLGGLQPVDVIVRRVNDDYCDPLELRPESLLGVPGLIQALRMGNVAVANTLGTGLIQSPAFLPYLPGLCRALLGEELILPSVRSLWCGQAKGFSEVRDHPERWVVKHAFPGAKPVFLAECGTAEQGEILARIQARPWAYVAQEKLVPAVTPALSDGVLAPRAYVLRCFAFAKARGGYDVMPGGLSRVAEGAGDGAVSMQLGAGSQDVWVLSREKVTSFSLLPPPNRTQPLHRGGGDLQSRVADDLYWLGRYTERAEAVARLARVIGSRLNELSDAGELERSTEFEPLFAALHAQTERVRDPNPRGRTLLDQREGELVAAIADTDANGSLLTVANSAVRLGRTVRDRVSADTWRVLAGLAEQLRSVTMRPGRYRLSSLLDILTTVIADMAAFGGLVMDSMTRGQAYRFLDMGRRVERAVTVVTLLRETTLRSSERETALLEAVLEAADSIMTYRRRYLALPQAAPVVDLLLADDTNPRSVLYQLHTLTEHLRALPRLPDASPRSPELKLALRASLDLELAEIERVCQPEPDGSRPLLSDLLSAVLQKLPALSDALSHSYLNHANLTRHLSQDIERPSDEGDGEAPI